MENFGAKKKALVTGAGGFIGSYLVERLMDADLEKTILWIKENLNHYRVVICEL
jgi:nucleoside-diphosphate-sugar epimerase